MTSQDWRKWQERSRPGEWAGPIIADLERVERALADHLAQCPQFVAVVKKIGESKPEWAGT